MARNKHSAALFEVIHSAKRPGLLHTPKWWFKSDGVPPEAAVESLPPVEEPTVAVPVMPTSLYGTRPNASRAVRLDRQRNEVTMRMRFGTAVVGTFAVLVALGLAYVVGQHVAGGPKTADASDVTTEEIRQKPPVPSTLEVPRRTPKQPVAPKSVATGTQTGAARHTDISRVKEPAAAGNAYLPEPKVTAVGPRESDKNYILVGNYEPKARKNADKLCDALNKAGIPCSIEKVPDKYFDPDGKNVAVITRQGFAGASDPECGACQKRIIAIAAAANLKTEIAVFKGTLLR